MTKLSKTEPAFWEAKETFISQLVAYVEEYKNELIKNKQNIGFVNGSERVAALFVKHLKEFTDYLSFEDVKVSDATTKFYAHAKWEGLKDWDRTEIKIRLRNFVVFLQKKGLQNETILEALQ